MFIVLTLVVLLGDETNTKAQESPNIHVVVNMVQLNVAVTDKNGNYITGLKPKDFTIVEDGIVEKAATFAEGNGPAHRLNDLGEPDMSTDLAQDAPNQLPSGDNACDPRIPGERSKRLRALRYQRLYVSRIRVRAGRYFRFHSVPGNG